MLDITNDTDVYTAHDEHVGRVGRIVLDPRTRAVSHVVVSKGILFREDRLVPISEIATATSERINLRRGVAVDELLPFEEQYYEPLPDEDRPAAALDQSIRLAMPLSGVVGEAVPAVDAELAPVSRRNIPDRLTAIPAGAPVISTDHEDVGRLERIVTSDQGQPTHIVVLETGLSPDRRLVPIDWASDITEDAIRLRVDRETVEAVGPLGPDE